MKKIFYKFCYLIYRNGKKYIRERELQNFKNIAEIDDGAKIGATANIYNCQKKSAIRIGNKTVLQGDLVTFGHGGEIVIGNSCFIGEQTRIWSAKKIVIGNRVLIAHNVNIHDQNSHPMDSAERHIDQMHILEKGFRRENNLNEKEINIHDDVWIGFNATIFKGVTIGKGAIIGACTLITQDVPEFAVVVGNPARIIKYTT
jgi:acetyltransferase-like isoleucine patch superfamily enzyme